MSVKTMAAVWELDLPQNEKFILLALADHADDHGFCYPSVGRLAWKSGYSIRQTQEILKHLRDRGVIEVWGVQPGGRGRTTRYRVCPEKGAKIAPFSEWCERRRARESVQPGAERMRQSAQKGAVATAPESPVIVREETSENHQATVSEERSQTGDDLDPQKLFATFKTEFVWLTPQHFAFGVLRVKARAKTPPHSILYWEKSLRRFFDSFNAETEVFLTEQAFELLAHEDPSIGIAEELKCRAAGHGLNYSSDLISLVIQRAQLQMDREKALRNELRAGTFNPQL